MDDVIKYGKYKIKDVKKITEAFYSEDKNLYGSIGQTIGFFNLLFHNLPIEVLADLKNTSILDWGCGGGVGSYMLRLLTHNTTKITGLDISSVAINHATVTYSTFDIDYTTKVLDDEKYDIIINSNCLEHFTNGLELVEKHLLNNTNKYYIILIPFKGRIVDEIGDHLVSYDDFDFPLELGGAKLCTKKLIWAGPYGCWLGNQLLVIYRK